MSSGAALFQILYQHETLFQLHETKPHVEIISEKIEEKTPNIIAPAPVADTIIIEKPVINPAVTVIQPIKPEVIIPPVKSFPVLEHKILILIDEPKQKEMIVSEALFLDNILKAVKSSADKADIINFSFLPKSDARSVLAEKKTNYFITFGVPLAKLHLDLLLIPYTPKIVEGIWFLLIDPLVVIEADRDLKRKLWQALQKMFETSN